MAPSHEIAPVRSRKRPGRASETRPLGNHGPAGLANATAEGPIRQPLGALSPCGQLSSQVGIAHVTANRRKGASTPCAGGAGSRSGILLNRPRPCRPTEAGEGGLRQQRAFRRPSRARGRPHPPRAVGRRERAHVAGGCRVDLVDFVGELRLLLERALRSRVRSAPAPRPRARRASDRPLNPRWRRLAATSRRIPRPPPGRRRH